MLSNPAHQYRHAFQGINLDIELYYCMVLFLFICLTTIEKFLKVLFLCLTGMTDDEILRAEMVSQLCMNDRTHSALLDLVSLSLIKTLNSSLVSHPGQFFFLKIFS